MYHFKLFNEVNFKIQHLMIDYAFKNVNYINSFWFLSVEQAKLSIEFLITILI